MYKVLLCLRYLATRYIALASIISVMLGVATMIVVNSVMAGFTTEMRDRIHGILADVIVETNQSGRPAQCRGTDRNRPQGGRRVHRGDHSHGRNSRHAHVRVGRPDDYKAVHPHRH